MDARILLRAAAMAALLMVAAGAEFRTPNYVVQTADPKFAETLAKSAEKYRKDLALEWLGAEMPNWAQPCPVTATAAPHLGAGGATTFVFDRGEVFGWRMTIQGSRERILDSVLPHEVTHMIFASHFRQPVPRWADEGGATTCEFDGEKAKHRRMLMDFLRTNRGIAFNQMFAMTEYPADVMPLYAQGFSLSEYLIELGGRRKFLTYLADGMKTNQWSEATRRHYGINDLGSLQRTWVGWVAQGSPPIRPKTTPEAAAPAPVLASADKPVRPEPNLIFRMRADETTGTAGVPMVPAVRPASAVAPVGETTPAHRIPVNQR